MTDDVTRLDRGDRIALYFSIVLAAVAIGLAGWGAVQRLAEVAPGHDIPVLVPLSGEQAALPLGPDGAAVTVDVETATVVVADPAPATLFALWAEPIVQFLAVAAGMVVASVFFLRVARGRVFKRGTAVLVIIGAGIVAGAWFVGSILTNMTTNGALSAVSDYTYDSAIFTADLAPFMWILVLGAVGAALQLGERLRRDTEGLV
ncbi:MAG: hypothetical protein CVT68_06795 [Actinobacteria bacterium HGW-Actinobacteria-8]|nr:MAG: hypothetical protein CVT68_06795 [Actinobacteria bacterium HGW-Actinobacteria-8]